MNLHFRAQEPREGYQLVASPANSPLRWQTFGLLRWMGTGGSYEKRLGGEEAILTLISGKATVEVAEPSGKSLHYSIGPRRDPFVDRATMVYLPPHSSFLVRSESPGFFAAFHSAPAEATGSSFLIQPGSLTPVSTGAGNWRRDVCLCTAPELPVQRFLIGETINPPGNWSSYPPHKHDEFAPPFEAPYEEVYFFLCKPDQGFGFIRLYEPMGRENPIDQAYVIQNGDTVVLPRGYHPVAAAPGYQLYYLFSLVGEQRQYGAWSDDPAHAWIRDVETILKNSH